jgi:hypothetical protein
MAFIEVDEVIGEYHDGDILYYFARYRQGIARKARVLIDIHGFLPNAWYPSFAQNSS